MRWRAAERGIAAAVSSVAYGDPVRAHLRCGAARCSAN
jgi:hypothetical protein